MSTQLSRPQRGAHAGIQHIMGELPSPLVTFKLQWRKDHRCACDHLGVVLDAVVVNKNWDLSRS